VDDIDVTRPALTPAGLWADSSAAWSRFAPGAMSAGRFRIIALPGRVVFD
jgi:hypothetical protein